MNYHLGHIPVSLINEVISRKWSTYFRTFIVLKYEYTNVAFFKNKEQAYNDTKDVLNISDKTFKTHLKKLVNLGFLGVDKNQSYYIRSYNHLRTAYGLKKTRKVEFTIKELTENHFTPYMFGAAIGYIALKKEFKKIWEVLKKGGINQSQKILKIQKSKLDFKSPLSASYLKSILGVSKSYINKQFNKAADLGYIFFEKDCRYTGITDSHISHITELYEDCGFYAFCYGGYIYTSHPNRCKATLMYKKEKR